MKMLGKKVEGYNIEICVIPRGEGEAHVFTAQAVIDMGDFDRLCPPPKPTIKMIKGGKKVEDVESPKFKRDMQVYGERRMQYMVLKSLEATEGLEWETINMSDP